MTTFGLHVIVALMAWALYGAVWVVVAAVVVAPLVLTVPALASPYESGGKVDEFIGAYTESIPIVVPPYHGIEPKLSLQYHSGRGVGYLGVGWVLQGLSVIERRELGTAPYWKNYYFLDGQLLLPCTEQDVPSPSCEQPLGRLGLGQKWFSTQSETYLRIEHGLDPDDNVMTFVVWKPNGTVHYYKPSGISGRFLLTKVIDTSGNTVRYEWTVANPSTNYPSRILYNGTTIAFHYRQRALTETFAEHGTLERMGWQLGAIDVCVNPSPTDTSSCSIAGAVDARRARAYSLSYRTSASTGRPLLTSVQMYGKDARISASLVFTGTGASPMSFDWSDRSPTYQASDQGFIANWGRDWLRGMVDFDGDGRTDFCRDTDDPKNNLWCAFSSGSKLIDLPVGQIADWGINDTASWVDWNGDGRTDFLRLSCVDDAGGSCEPHEHKNYIILAALSTGNGIDDVRIGDPLPEGEEGNPGERWFVDWNGDGRADFCRAVQRGAGSQAQLLMVCALSTGRSYVDTVVGELTDPTFSGSLAGALGYPETRAMVDWNGDGRTDFCRVVDEQGEERLKCLFGRISEYDRDRLPLGYNDDLTIGKISDRGSADTQWYVDVNGDGASDYCRLIGTAEIYCAISTQTGLIDTLWASSQTKFGSAQSRRWGDVNGDRKMDLCFDGPGANKECVISQGLTGLIQSGHGVVVTSFTNQHWLVDWDGDGRSEYCFTAGSAGGSGSRLTCIKRDPGALLDLATGTWNGAGGGTGVTYAPSTKFGGGRVRLPVVETFTRFGGAEGPTTQTFRYSDAGYDAFTRRFLGFRVVRITDPCLSTETPPLQCPYTEITSRLGWRWPTVPTRISRYGSYPPVELSRQELAYADSTQRPYRSDLISDTRTHFEGVDVVATRRSFGHDRYGNITTLNDHGAITDTTGYLGNVVDDDRTLTMVFAYNSDKYIVDKPARVTGRDAQGMLTDVLYSYDDAPSWTTAPTRGFVTHAQVWLDTTNTYLSSFMTFDAWGNPKSETDRNGNTTDYEYDAAYHVYLTKTTLPAAGTPSVRQTKETALHHWDVQCGQRRQEWAPNSAVTYFEYDELCRRIRTEVLGGTWETVSYHDYSFPNVMPYIEVRTPGPVASAYSLSDMWKRTYLDGVGRVTKVVRNGPNQAGNGGTEIIEKEITYDKRGNVSSMTKPRYAADPVHTYTYAYDIRDREVAANLPSANFAGHWHPGDSRTRSYSMLAAVTRDGLGHAEMIIYDARGRRLRAGSTDGSLNPRDLTYYSYDRHGNLNRIEQGTQLGTAYAVTSYVYDSLGRKISSTESNSGTRRYDYDNKTNITTEVDDATGVRTRHTYDALDRRTSKTVPFCEPACANAMVSTWRYDEPRQGFDNLGQLTSTTDASGVATYNYDLAGNLVEGGRTVNGMGPYTFTKYYDYTGRLLATRYPDGTSIGTTSLPIRYDEAGRVASIPGFIENAKYDASGTLTHYKAANGAEATYDTANPRGQVSAYMYHGKKSTGSEGVVGVYELTGTASPTAYREFVLPNPLKRGDTITASTCGVSVSGASGTGDTALRLFVRPVFQPYSYQRASNDNALAPGCGGLSTVTYTATEDGEVFIRAGCAGGTSCTGVVAVRIERGAQNLALGRPVVQSSMFDATCGPSSSVVDGVTNGNWCTSSSMLHTQFQANPWLVIDLGVDQDIRRIDVYNRSDSNMCDAACLARLANFDLFVLATAGGGWVHVAHVLEQAQLPTPISVIAHGRYVLLRLRGTDYLNTPEVQVFGPGVGAQPLLETQPVFEQARLDREADGRIRKINTSRSRSSWTYTYSPDHMRQLWSATNPEPALSRSYETDNGNLTVAHPTTYGRAPGVQPHAIYRSGADEFTYDANGQRRSSVSAGAYEWNPGRQLTRYDDVRYTYDAEGYRLTKTVGQETTIYLGDDYEISSLTGEHTKYVTLGGRLVAKQTTSGDVTYLLTDHLGSVILVLDGNATIIESTSYGPFGETIAGDDTDRRGYTGQRKDRNGLVYLHARFYDPQTGRLISPDPAISSEHPIGMNRYAYALNDPINRTDIDGLGVWENVASDLGEASRVTANFLSNINLVDMMQWISNESGHKAPVRKYLGGFNMGVGKSLALIVGKFHAAAEGDWQTYGKMVGSELAISAAVAASILSYGTAAAPAVAIASAIALPTTLTFIQTQDLDDTRDAALGTLPGIAGQIGTELAMPAATPYLNTMKKELADAFAPILERFKKLFGGGGGSGNGGALAWSAISVLIAAEPYIVIDSRMHATSISPQGRLSSSSGTLFGYGYKTHE